MSDLILSRGQVQNPADLTFGDETDGRVNLIYDRSPVFESPVDLVLGGEAIIVPPRRDVTLSMVLPGPTVSARVVPPNDAVLVGTMPGLSLTAEVDFDSNVSRPTVGRTAAHHQTAVPTPNGPETRHRTGLKTQGLAETWHTAAQPIIVGVDSRTQGAVSLGGISSASRHQDAMRVPASSVKHRHGDALRGARLNSSSRHQDGVPIRSSIWTDWQERYRDRRPAHKSLFQDGAKLRRGLSQSHQDGVPIFFQRGGRYQEAMRPPAGRYTPPIPPGPEPCYTPSTHLLYSAGPGDSHLLFICENHTAPEPPPPGQVVVPVRKVYIVLNDVSLKRVSGNVDLLALDLSMTLDADSWSWSWSARLPLRSEDDVMPSGSPVEVEASINGTAYRLLVENVARERSFGSTSVRVSGRGKSALLAAPYAPVMTFSNDIARTAQQLMNDALMVNGVPLGWTVDWQLTDWLVPADAFSVRGSHMDALNSIVGAVGGYIQPHPSTQLLRALPRYPTKPWTWNTVTPDYELPAAVTTREGIEWKDNPDYNRVFVSGQGQGVLGQVTRQGTAGDLAAPMVVDPLITHADAARQRGLAILGAAGSKANVSLTLPVLPATGVIQPGKMVRYVDGAMTRIGIVRSTSVNAAMPTLRQTLVLETQA